MYLTEIIEYKRIEAAKMKLPEISRKKGHIDPVHSLVRKPFIAEIKKASPSAGDIRPDLDVIATARKYLEGGAGAISVLTDEKYFKGSFDFLSKIADAVALPVLCKDFIVSEIQIENAYLHGADFILLIAAALDENEMAFLSKKAADMKMKVLYEIHSIDEFDKIKSLAPEMVGVNSRNLQSFKIDLDAGAAVVKSLNGNFLKIAESGIETSEDIKKFRTSGADAFLIGSSLVRSKDPSVKLKEFYGAL